MSINDVPKWLDAKKALTTALERLDARIRHAIPDLQGGLVTRSNLGAKVLFKHHTCGICCSSLKLLLCHLNV